MKFVSVSLVKDEADIIELFIRINSRVIDHFFIVDNGSSDNTVKILEKLGQEGFKITLFRDPDPHYNQSLMTTKALRYIANNTQFDWAFILDADEFVNIEKSALEKELSKIPGNQIASLRWATWIPKSDIWYKCDNPLWTGFTKKKNETEKYEKVIISSRLAPTIIVGLGNHEAHITLNDSLRLVDGSVKVDQNCLTCGELDHVPVRSSLQVLLKVLMGSLKLSIKKDRVAYEGYHWDRAASLVRQYKYEVDDILLRYLALNYLANPKKDIVDEVDETAKLGLETDVIQYKRLYKINERSRFFNFMVSFTDPLRK